MYNSKPIALLRTLGPTERRRFKKWLASPLHNANRTLSRFYAYLERRQELTERALRRERAFAHLFGEEPYDDLIMRRLLSEFFQQLEDFLAFADAHERPAEIALARARLFRTRQMPREAAARWQQAVGCLQAQPERDARYYFDAYRLQEEKLRQTHARDAALNVQEMTDELAAFFAAEMLRNACTAASHQAVYRANYRMPYLDAILADCECGRFDSIPVIRLYFLSYRCLTRPDAEADFRALKAMLPEAGHWLPMDELRNVVTFAVNYCILRLNTDAHEFLRDVFDLYQTGLEQGIFVENGLMSRFTFKNIVSAALALGETDWTAVFIRDYAPLLPPEQREAYERFCMAKLRYQQRDYAEAQNLLHNLAFDDVFLDLGARVLLLKIYFENREWRLLRGFLNAFERFVGRKKMLPYQAPNYLNLIHLTARLLALQNSHKPVEAGEWASLREQIRRAQPLTERGWLEQMLILHIPA